MKASQKLASFAQMDTPPVNAEAWPLHELLWLQSELNPVRPRESGLRIERRHKPPAPDFLATEIEPMSAPPERELACDPLFPRFARRLPQDDLVPLGWDPRSLCGKGDAA